MSGVRPYFFLKTPKSTMVSSFFLVSFRAKNSSEGPLSCFLLASLIRSSSCFFFNVSSSAYFWIFLCSIYSAFLLATSCFASAAFSSFFFSTSSLASFSCLFLFMISSKCSYAFVGGLFIWGREDEEVGMSDIFGVEVFETIGSKSTLSYLRDCIRCRLPPWGLYLIITPLVKVEWPEGVVPVLWIIIGS